RKASADGLDPTGFALASSVSDKDSAKHSQANKPKTEDEQAVVDANLANLKMKKSWDTALGPLKQAPMQGFMLYMSGNSVQIYSIMVTVMLFQNALRGIFSTEQAFARFETTDTTADTTSSDKKASKSSQSLLLPKVVYVFAQLVLMGLGLYKCHSMGLLPTSHSDWLSFLEPKRVVEFSTHGSFI
ncbi:hypothetical protein BC830DRAFT_1110275, partial [Chytriomyces sp. MP71]